MMMMMPLNLIRCCSGPRPWAVSDHFPISVQFVHTKTDSDGEEVVTICCRCAEKVDGSDDETDTDVDTRSVMSDSKESQGFRHCSKKHQSQVSIDTVGRVEESSINGEVSDEDTDMGEVDGSETSTALALIDLFSSA